MGLFDGFVVKGVTDIRRFWCFWIVRWIVRLGLNPAEFCGFRGFGKSHYPEIASLIYYKGRGWRIKRTPAFFLYKKTDVLFNYLQIYVLLLLTPLTSTAKKRRISATLKPKNPVSISWPFLFVPLMFWILGRFSG